MPHSSFTVKSESIGMGNVHIVQKVFLTRPTVKHTRNSADTDKSAWCVYVRDRLDKRNRSRIPGPISDIQGMTSQDQDIWLWKMLWPRNRGLDHSVSLKMTAIDRPHASVCWRSCNCVFYLGVISQLQYKNPCKNNFATLSLFNTP